MSQRGAPALVVLAAGQARRYGGPKPLAPVGPAGEPVIDVVASDALAGGFSKVVLVVNPSTGPAIRYRVARCWPKEVEVAFAVQEHPRGTVDAVLAAAAQLPADQPFGVANADDVYGRPALRLLAGHLASSPADHALVAFRLACSVVSDAPVTRGICSVDGAGWLADLVERRHVHPQSGGFVAEDGLEPARLSGDEAVSMNLWAFTPAIWEALRSAMAAGSPRGSEVLLPEVVGAMVRGGRGPVPAGRFAVHVTDGRCIGVTHHSDLELVQAELAYEVASGSRPAALWSGRAEPPATRQPTRRGPG